MDIEDFDAVFRGSEDGYDKDHVDSILSHQAYLGGKLFFQRLLELLKIKWRGIYPPATPSAVHDLHKRIISSETAVHNKQCLLYYILKDLSPTFKGDSDLATDFATAVHLEHKFWTFLEGIWALDNLAFDTAVGYLTHPAIIPTFPDEIMLALLIPRAPRGDPIESSAHVLPMAYYNCAKPPLVNENAKKEFVRYMADRSVTETFYWIRGRPDHERKHLLEILIEQALEPPIQRVENTMYKREDRAEELVSLPFGEEEEAWVERFLTEGKGRHFKGAADTVVMRRMATGRFADVGKEGGKKGKKIGAVNWEVLREGVRKGMGPRVEDGEAFMA
ncbi:nuclear pore complex assembly-domain-containing protein [Clohesyomyces aquaticus]|uniref:Nuclear pore complex assembly-domain-containing protein n=1 Tax=Clohesyomyces aquaticus TaxID=1231657 RepID=A0A1Y1Y8Y0_9PLEO|nr:nuclear pore complex assembly-domain-containing protein [Clohesyomyces aquaticus]